MDSEETIFLGKEIFNSIKKFERKEKTFESLLKKFSKDLTDHHTDILVSSFGFYKSGSFTTLSDSWEKKTEDSSFNNIVAFFNNAVEYLNAEKALSLTRYIFDNDIQCLKILTQKNNALVNEPYFKTLHIPFDKNASTLDEVNGSSDFNKTINEQSIEESILDGFTLSEDEKEPFRKIVKVYKQYLTCRNTDVIYFLNPQHQINEQKIALILICSKELSYQDLYKIMIFFRAIVSEELYDKIQEAALRAAISQVMARNTSHNIGAHVMNKLIGDLSSLALLDFSKINEHNYQSTYEKDLRKIHSEVNTNDPDLQSLTEAQKEKVLKHRILLVQIALFNNYVKCRMDYLADISFGTPLMQTNKLAYGELFTDLDKVRLLLEHISGLDSFKYEIKFTRNGKRFAASKKENEQTNGEEFADDLLVAIPNDILGTQAFYNILENIIRNTAKHSSQKPEITVFTVNFIDEVNGAKEYYTTSINGGSTTDSNRKTEIENTLNEFIAVEVYDNIPVNDKHSLSSDEKKKYAAAIKKEENEITEPLDKIEWLVYNQNKKLNEDILHENKLRSSSLGLVEMDASAAYLRKRPVEYINHTSYDIQYDESWSRDTEKNRENNQDPIALRGTNCRHFLKAFNTDGKLGYRFFLHRPAVVLVVTDDECTNKDTLKKEGIWIVSPTEFKKELEGENGKPGKVYPHEFVVIDKDVTLPTIKEKTKDKEGNETENDVAFLEYYKTSLPIRVLKEEQSKLKELFDAKEETKEINCNGTKTEITKTVLDAWEEWCWGEWYKELKTIYAIESNSEIQINTSFDCNTVDENFNAVFLDHGQKTWKNFNTCNNIDYLDGVSSKAQDKIPGRKKYQVCYPDFEKNFIPNIYKLKLERNKLRESIRSKILVIDERIQNQIHNVFHEEILFHEVYKKSGIIIPDTYSKAPFYCEENKSVEENKFNLSANSIDDSFGKALKNYINHYVNTLLKTDFILIHYSILERVFEKETNKTSSINDFLNVISKENAPQIVITSGRGGGALTELTPKVRFVNLSSIITSFVEIKSKYYSNYLLHSSRKNNGKN